MYTVEKYLEDSYRLWYVILKNSDKQDPELLAEYRWSAEYYRDGLAQYQMLHNSVLTYVKPRLELWEHMFANEFKIIQDKIEQLEVDWS